MNGSGIVTEGYELLTIVNITPSTREWNSLLNSWQVDERWDKCVYTSGLGYTPAVNGKVGEGHSLAAYESEQSDPPRPPLRVRVILSTYDEEFSFEFLPYLTDRQRWKVYRRIDVIDSSESSPFPSTFQGSSGGTAYIAPSLYLNSNRCRWAYVTELFDNSDARDLKNRIELGSYGIPITFPSWPGTPPMMMAFAL